MRQSKALPLTAGCQQGYVAWTRGIREPRPSSNYAPAWETFVGSRPSISHHLLSTYRLRRPQRPGGWWSHCRGPTPPLLRVLQRQVAPECRQCYRRCSGGWPPLGSLSLCFVALSASRCCIRPWAISRGNQNEHRKRSSSLRPPLWSFFIVQNILYKALLRYHLCHATICVS
ncbi:hypothetical protein BC629DRAFT_234370 [Irpex lacteus]|nr:hypothetical protein BC629DRAFT_234370 [Irpex lacteus]